jgi:ribonuclease P protein component
MRFRAEQHLRRQGEIRSVRETGRRIDCRAFTLWGKGPGQAATGPSHPARVCVIASTHAVGGAVRRNQAKRRLRELFRHHQHEVPAGYDLLLIARAAVTSRPMAELEAQFSDACRRLPGPSQP